MKVIYAPIVKTASPNFWLNLRTASELHLCSQQVCREWEASALKVHKDVRLALIRIGVVLGKDGGALGKVLTIIKHFLVFKF